MRHWQSVLLAATATFTITYGGSKTLTIQGPADDAFCAARREALMLNAKITVPAGTYEGVCDAVGASGVPGVTIGTAPDDEPYEPYVAK